MCEVHYCLILYEQNGGLRGSANRLRSAARSALPAVVSPGFSIEPPHDDDHLGEGDPEVNDRLTPFGTPHELLVGIIPGVLRALHHPPLRSLQGSRLALLRDHRVQAAIL
jgi:hypothetical protein